MEIPLWLVYSLSATLFFGLFSFIQKYGASAKKYEVNSYIFFLYLMGLFISGTFILINGLNLLELNFIIFAFLTAVFHTINSKTRFISLRYLSASFHFINYRLVTSILLLILGFIIFGEKLTYMQILGIISGFLVFFLLYEKAETKREGFEKGLIFLGISILLITITNLIAKYMALNINDFISYLFIYYVSCMIVLIVQGISQKNFNLIMKKQKRTFYILSFVQSFCFYASFFFLLKALQLQSLAIVYKILSFEIMIPIILTILFLGEKITMRKLLAFAFTIVSILFFI